MRAFVIAVGAVVAGLLILAAGGLIAAIPLYFLWNWLMPELFRLPLVTYPQAWGLVFLAAILFKDGGTSSK